MSAKRVLLCECKVNRVLPPEAIQRAMASLRRRDVDLVIAEDLCGLAARNDPSLRELLKEPLSVLACHPRAVKYLLRRMVCACGANRIELRDLREEDASSLGESLGLPTEAEPEVDRRERRITWDEDWIPWFPVIDLDRCSGCGQCLSFCLFGVFEASEEGGVRVARPKGCKTYCPACARVCPEGAVIFPKHEEPEIYGVPPETLGRDPREALDSISKDVHAALERHRRKRSQRILDRERVARAIQEREQCSCERDSEDEAT